MKNDPIFAASQERRRRGAPPFSTAIDFSGGILFFPSLHTPPRMVFDNFLAGACLAADNVKPPLECASEPACLPRPTATMSSTPMLRASGEILADGAHRTFQCIHCPGICQLPPGVVTFPDACGGNFSICLAAPWLASPPRESMSAFGWARTEAASLAPRIVVHGEAFALDLDLVC